jgi:hypothetical protein
MATSPPPDQQASLLAAKKSAGVSGATLAIQSGHAETVAAFSDAVLHSALPPELKVALLSTALASVTPGPRTSFARGWTR